MKISLKMPGSWNELSAFQFKKIAMLFYTQTPGFKLEVKIIKILLDYKWYQFIAKARFDYVLTQVPFSELRKNILFLYEKNNRTVFLPEIKVGNKIYYAPMDRIINLSAHEFAVADDLHALFRSKNEPEALHYLFHLLYSETKERPVFNKLNLPESVNKKVPLSVLIATEFTYFGCKNHLVNTYKKVFPKSESKKQTKHIGFDKVILGMAKGDLSKLPIIQNINIYIFLEQFQEDIILAQKSKTT